MLHALLPFALALLAAGCATRAPERAEAPRAVAEPIAAPAIEPIAAPLPSPRVADAAPAPTAEPAAPPPPAVAPQAGLASWYGRAFHGRRTASGELYNRHALSAAHRTLPIPSYARVTNPANGRSVIVRVNDRGPFIDGRVIDLSEQAARRLGSTALGVAPVTVEPIDAADAGLRPPGDGGDARPGAPQRAFTRAGRGFWIELAAQRHREAALQWQQRAAERLDADGSLHLLLAVFDGDALHRVQAGPFERRDDAHRVAERLRAGLGLQPVAVFERR